MELPLLLEVEVVRDSEYLFELLVEPEGVVVSGGVEAVLGGGGVARGEGRGRVGVGLGEQEVVVEQAVFFEVLVFGKLHVTLIYYLNSWPNNSTGPPSILSTNNHSTVIISRTRSLAYRIFPFPVSWSTR